MNHFCPDGYVVVREAILDAMLCWNLERLEAMSTNCSSDRPTEPCGAAELAWAVLSAQDMQKLVADVVVETEHRLRNLLHQGRLTAYYFGGLFSEGRNALPREFWATGSANGVLLAGSYFPFGPGRIFERRTSYPLFLMRAELDTLLEQEAFDVAAQADPPGRKPGRQSAKRRASEIICAILNDDSKRPKRRHGRKALLARMVAEVLQQEGLRYLEDTVQKMIRETVKEWEARNPGK